MKCSASLIVEEGVAAERFAPKCGVHARERTRQVAVQRGERLGIASGRAECEMVPAPWAIPSHAASVREQAAPQGHS